MVVLVNITSKANGCLRILLRMVKTYPNKPVHAEELSKELGITIKYIQQLLLLLKNEGFIKSKKGPKGGYTLARDPDQIILGDALRKVENLSFPLSAVDGDSSSKDVFDKIWCEVGESISEILDSISFAELDDLQRQSKLNSSINYYI